MQIPGLHSKSQSRRCFFCAFWPEQHLLLSEIFLITDVATSLAFDLISKLLVWTLDSTLYSGRKKDFQQQSYVCMQHARTRYYARDVWRTCKHSISPEKALIGTSSLILYCANCVGGDGAARRGASSSGCGQKSRGKGAGAGRAMPQSSSISNWEIVTGKCCESSSQLPRIEEEEEKNGQYPSVYTLLSFLFAIRERGVKLPENEVLVQWHRIHQLQTTKKGTFLIDWNNQMNEQSKQQMSVWALEGLFLSANPPPERKDRFPAIKGRRMFLVVYYSTTPLEKMGWWMLILLNASREGA